MAHPDENEEYLRRVQAKGVQWYWGKVVDNADPDMLGRIRANVPSITPRSQWAWPVGMMGGGSSRQGAYVVPRNKAVVIVGFVLGDFDQPFYVAGPWAMGKDAKPGVPRKIQQQTDPKIAPDVRVLAETESFEVYICDQDDEQRLVLAGLDGNETISINLIDGSIRLTASHFMKIEAPRISINATAQLSLNDRIVGWNGPKI